MILRFEIEVFGELSRGEHLLRDDVAKRSNLVELWLFIQGMPVIGVGVSLSLFNANVSWC